jgi:hypothetical protein
MDKDRYKHLDLDNAVDNVITKEDMTERDNNKLLTFPSDNNLTISEQK